MTEDDLRAAVSDCEAAIEEAREKRNAVIAKAAAEGMRQVDIIKATGMSRETVRRITQAGRETSDA